MIEAEACQNANELTARIMARAGDGLISDVTVRAVRLVLLPEMEGSYLILYQQYMSFCIDLQCFNFKLQASRLQVVFFSCFASIYTIQTNRVMPTDH